MSDIEYIDDSTDLITCGYIRSNYRSYIPSDLYRLIIKWVGHLLSRGIYRWNIPDTLLKKIKTSQNEEVFSSDSFYVRQCGNWKHILMVMTLKMDHLSLYLLNYYRCH